MTEQPHFDDELTVLTARRVVPLERIDAKVKHRRRWFLGGAFAIAMLLGAASALISAYFKLRNAPEPEIQASSVSEPVVDMSVLPVLEEQPPTPLPKRPRPKVRNTDKTDRPLTRPRLSEDDELRQIRAAVLVDEWQERRQRRVRRPTQQHHQRDLGNIDEIFEGRPRP